MIEQLYPTVPKIELNRRGPRPGWDAWGAEAED
jgi:N6-adenosine-specific RNA methylase IME4